jgi:aspartyl-tRNA(Asn)/glutamyl-tRNA(Gln) amidotransferase subunit A
MRPPVPGSIAALHATGDAGERAREWTQAALDALAQSDAGAEPLNAFISVDPERALAEAAEVEQAHGSGVPHGALAGVPVAVKDNIATLHLPTTCASRVLDGYTSPYDATAVQRLREAGAVILGKTNLDEFAMGSSTESSAFGVTRNPIDRSRVPGGSSGGSAAAVAAGIVPVALGSETGGSVRQPAAYCGIVGIKPTYGRVSRYGLVAFASSFAQIGTFGRTVHDAALLLATISGADRFDSTCVDRPAGEVMPPADRHDLAGQVIGVPVEYFPDSLDARIAERCRQALARLEERGAEIREISLPHTPLAIPTYYVIAPAEASSNLARFDGVRYGARAADATSLEEVYERTRALFGAEVKRRIMLGTYVLSAGHYDEYYGRAQRVRALIADDFRRAFASGVDAIFTPTTPAPAFRLGEFTSDPYEMYLSDVFTVTANLAGLPALSLPIGEVDGLPVGGQLIGRHWAEGEIVRIAAALEASYALTPAGRTDA